MNAHCFGKGCLPSTSGYDDQVSTLFWPYSVPDTYAGPRNNPADSLQASLITHYSLQTSTNVLVIALTATNAKKRVNL